MQSNLLKGISIAMMVGFVLWLIFDFVHFSTVKIAMNAEIEGAEDALFGTILYIVHGILGLFTGILGVSSLSIELRYIAVVLTIVLGICAIFVLANGVFGILVGFVLPAFYLVGLYQENKLRA